MSKWIIDPDHSVGAFAIRHLTVAFVHGQMNKLSGTINYDETNVASTTIDFEIEVASIITGIAKRDDHLKSADFFDTEKYPKIFFKSKTIHESDGSISKITGDLTIRGITQSVTLDVDLAGPVKSPFGETSIGLTAVTTFNREDFGIKWNEPLEDGGFMVGSEVEVSVDLEADLTE
jgi:polyisoprenoid-binding protein YceI